MYIANISVIYFGLNNIFPKFSDVHRCKQIDSLYLEINTVSGETDGQWKMTWFSNIFLINAL